MLALSVCSSALASFIEARYRSKRAARPYRRRYCDEAENGERAITATARAAA
jgi:hypothetical protein